MKKGLGRLKQELFAFIQLRKIRRLRNGEIVIKPITDDYIRNMAGMAGTKGKLLKALMEEKAKERDIHRR